jgi:type IV secretory pathway VirB4 component
MMIWPGSLCPGEYRRPRPASRCPANPIGLNDREIEIIAGATPKRQYYYKTDEHQRIFDLAPGPLALAFVGVSDKESVSQVKKCQQQFGDDWINEWLRRRGLTMSEYIGEQEPVEARELAGV